MTNMRQICCCSGNSTIKTFGRTVVAESNWIWSAFCARFRDMEYSNSWKALFSIVRLQRTDFQWKIIKFQLTRKEFDRTNDPLASRRRHVVERSLFLVHLKSSIEFSLWESQIYLYVCDQLFARWADHQVEWRYAAYLKLLMNLSSWFGVFFYTEREIFLDFNLREIFKENFVQSESSSLPPWWKNGFQ